MQTESATGKRILVAPLDWGLGHATRCIPIIRELLQMGCEVLIGAEGKQAALLQEEFPSVTILPLAGYHIEYTRGASGFGMKMARQLPRIRRAIKGEHRWLKQMVPQYAIDAVISDNRFGLHYSGIPCVIMTHQLRIKSPLGSWTENGLQKANYHYIRPFDACWVVDSEKPNNLAGVLSNPRKLPPVPVHHLGPLSRFEYRKSEKTKYDLLAVISGPEPQRTIFEQLLLAQIAEARITALVVTGKPDEPEKRSPAPHFEIVNHLNRRQLNDALLQSKLVVCRAGYTSIMDLVKLKKEAILVPTPGQTEQEYLGEYLMRKGYFTAVSQDSLHLKEALKKETGSRHPPDGIPMDQYKKVVKDFVEAI